jgi:hypothetical protein
MNRRNARNLVLPLFAVGLMTAGSSHALEDAPGSKQAVKPASTAPVNRTIKFEKGETITFRQRLEIYNRAKPDSDKLHCREDRMTGSHRKKMRCVTLATKRLEEDAARAFFRALR